MSGTGVTGRLVNRADLAALWGTSLPTIDAWVRQGCPFVKRGSKGKEWQFDTAAVAEWRISRAVEDALSDVQDEGGRMSREEADRRRAVAAAISAEIQADRDLGTVVEKNAAEADTAAFCIALKTALTTAAAKIAARAALITSAPEIQELCETELNRAFNAAQSDLVSQWSDRAHDDDREDEQP
ncbi:terminase small subunit [Microvirga vignae]|uniref:terminase small subunit n=1 Tax=Microvirga vignae TaxID=1225564 RepID=UPI00069A29B3|nr:terminase small subunit [Microvirga vignae]